MEKMHIVFDVEKCVGCYNCLMACQDEFCGNRWLPYTDSQELHGQSWIRTTRHERGQAPITEVAFITETCRHCKNAPCEKAFPDAVIRRDDGIVLLDAEKARGNRALTGACPYGMIVWNEELQSAQKCTLCAHLLDQGWKEPRCVQACPLRALSIVKCSDEDFAAIASGQRLKPLGGCGTQPRLLYKNLYKINSVYVYGAVASMHGGVERAVEGADVSLLLNGELIAEAKTDFFGEYKIDRLPKKSGRFELRINAKGFEPVSLAVSVGDECVNAGVCRLG